MARPSLGLVLGIVATVGVVAAVVAGLSLIDGPQARRDTRLDDKRIADLKHLAGAIDCYWTLEKGGALPDDLDALAARLDAGWRETELPGKCRMRDRSDPETAEPYGYRVLNGAEYELCATFSRASENDSPGFSNEHVRWRHEAGELCFALRAENIDLGAAEPPQYEFYSQPLSSDSSN